MNDLINKKIKSVMDNYPRYAIEFTDGTCLGFTVDPSAAPNDIFTEGPAEHIDSYMYPTG